MLKLFRSKEWVILSRRQDFLNKTPEYLYKNCKLCAQHFEDAMFTNHLKNRLNAQAKPTLFNIPNPPPRVRQKRRMLQRSTSPVVTGNALLVLFGQQYTGHIT